MEEEIAEIVREHGWFAASNSDHNPPFLYSIGLMQTFNHPELIVFGLEPNDAHALVSGLVVQIRSGNSFAQPGLYLVTQQVGVRTVHPTQHPLYLGFAMGYCRFAGQPGNLQAVQVFWSDRAGKFPFEVGCDLGVFGLQPRLDIALSPTEVRQFQRQWE